MQVGQREEAGFKLRRVPAQVELRSLGSKSCTLVFRKANACEPDALPVVEQVSKDSTVMLDDGDGVALHKSCKAPMFLLKSLTTDEDDLEGEYAHLPSIPEGLKNTLKELNSSQQRSQSLSQPRSVLLLLAGVQGSGKSTFGQLLERHAPTPWKRICQDNIRDDGKSGSRAQCIEKARAALLGIDSSEDAQTQRLSKPHSAASVVIDRTNLNKEQRADFIRLAEELKVLVTVCAEEI